MRVVHLSDIHLSTKNIKDFKQYYLEALLLDLSNFDKEKNIDLIVITGDILDKGGASFNTTDNPYDIFKESFIDKILSTLKRDVPILYAVGNHDLVINSETVDEILEAGIESKIKTISEINTFIDSYRNKDYPIFKKQERFKDFQNNQSVEPLVKKYESNFESASILNINGKKIGIASFNSSWRCTPALPEKTMNFGSRQILEASDFFEKNHTDFNIGLIHHSPNLFNEEEKREVIKFLEIKNIDYLFCGHSHHSESEPINGSKGNIFFVTARAGFNDPREKAKDYVPGYNIVDIDYKNNKTTCYFQKYIHSRIEFDKDVDAAPNGRIDEKIKTYSDEDSFQELVNLSNSIFDARKDDIDSSLVIFGTNTVAPQKLKDIFVLPKLTNTPENYTGDDSEIYDSLNSIINESDKVLLVGRKETGKTTLLHRIFSEVSCSFHQYQKIPVFIDFQSIAKKEINTLIRLFLTKGANKVKELLEESKIILLIDNVAENGSETNQIAIKKLNSFIGEYSDTQIICTTSIDIDILLSNDDIIFNKRKFKPIFINKVGTDQYKELAQNWFNNQRQDWINENLNKLIKTFEILRIPHTFFSISLFLWIIEKQENFKPQNQAILVDMFLRYILEGLKSDESKAGTYNYDRKIELISEIAYKMYKKGDTSQNYALKESEIIKCIEENFTLNQRVWNAHEKLQELLEKGILIRDQIDPMYLCFRFESFFKYLLSLYIDSDTSFKSEVLASENILCFIDELDFYTARKQNDVEVLDLVFKIFQESFEEINSQISDDIDSYIPQQSIFAHKIKSKKAIEQIKGSKLSDEEIENNLSDQFDCLPVSTSIQIKTQTNHKENFHKSLELAARVLKNSENIKDPEKINNYLNELLRMSSKYGIYIHSIFLNQYKNKNELHFPIPKEVFLIIAPLINQLLLLTWLGTDFIEIPVRKHLDGMYASDKISEYELYLVTFLYTDMHFGKYINYLKEAVKKIRNPYIAELCLMKIFLYYMMRPSNSSNLEELEKLMKKLLVKARGIPKSKATSILNGFRKKKRLTE